MKLKSVKIQSFKIKFSKIKLVDKSAQNFIKGGGDGDPPPFDWSCTCKVGTKCTCGGNRYP